MATPLGHALSGIALGAALCPRLLATPHRDWLLFAMVALLPDLDFLPGLLIGRPSLYHHGPSHSLGFAVLAGAAFALYGRWRGGSPWRWGLVSGLIYLLHVVIDAWTLDTGPPYGVPLWWPLYSGYVYLQPSLLKDVKRGALDWFTIAHNLRAVAWELLFWGPPALAALWLRHRRSLKTA